MPNLPTEKLYVNWSGGQCPRGTQFGQMTLLSENDEDQLVHHIDWGGRHSGRDSDEMSR